MSDERERAEALLNQLDTLARAYDAYVLGLSPLPEERAKYFDAILAYAREERAQVWNEAADRVGPHDDLHFEWLLRAKMLREEGRGDE